MSEHIILVDEQDNEIGYGEKLDVHVKKQLHRAFSIFIYDQKNHKMLLQKRAEGKYHSGGKWSNACCSHPRKGEVMEEALARRLQEELGFSMPEKVKIHLYPDFPEHVGVQDMIEMGHFTYFAQFDGLAEHEIDHVFVYFPSEEQIKNMQCNPEEIGEVKWIDLQILLVEMENEPDIFSAWFKPALNLVCKMLKPADLQ